MHERPLTEYLHVLKRRFWILIQPVIIIPVIVVLYSMSQAAQYETSADVLLRSQTLPSAVSGIADPSAQPYVDPDRVASTQIAIARLPVMAERVVAAANPPGMTAGEFLGSSSVTAVPDTDFLRFGVRTNDPELAVALANEYARQYARYRTELDTKSVETSLQTLRARIADLRAGGTRASRLAPADLQEKANQVATLAALQQANAVVVREAEGAGQVEPRPVRNGAIAVALGLILGLGLALLREATDTRLRSPEQISTILDLPLLARLPDPGRRLRRKDRLAMLAKPDSVSAEAFRIMRTNLEFTSLGRDVRAILITSALEGEGKSTTAANLAVALARAGSNVALIDLDLRRPGVGRFFDLEFGRPGVTNVVLGHAVLDDALAPIALGSGRVADRAADGGRNGNPHAITTGSLEVLSAGPVPPNPGEFVGSERVRRIIRTLRERKDYVIVDSPPALHVGDAMTIARSVDGIVIVVNTDIARRPVLGELGQVVQRAPADGLGFVVCGGTAVSSYQYDGYYAPSERRSRTERELVR